MEAGERWTLNDVPRPVIPLVEQQELPLSQVYDSGSEPNRIMGTWEQNVYGESMPDALKLAICEGEFTESEARQVKLYLITSTSAGAY
jgi:hypothetical protein